MNEGAGGGAEFPVSRVVQPPVLKDGAIAGLGFTARFGAGGSAVAVGGTEFPAAQPDLRSEGAATGTSGVAGVDAWPTVAHPDFLKQLVPG